LATVTVGVVNFAFTPTNVTIHVGDTVQWVWQSNDHSATSVKGSAEQWDSGVQNNGFTFDHTFTQTGTFAYYCVIHGVDNGNGTASGMAGKVIVTSGTSNPTPTPTPTAAPLHASGHNAKAKVNKAFHATLASFNEARTTRGNFTVLIAWGDNSTPTFGQISGRKNKFKVAGSHRYFTPGVFQVMVMIQDASGPMANVMDTVKVTGK
jgi:plastocyanin